MASSPKVQATKSAFDIQRGQRLEMSERLRFEIEQAAWAESSETGLSTLAPIHALIVNGWRAPRAQGI